MMQKINIELLFWIGGLIWLVLINPSEIHFTICPIKNMGFSCSGCGLGRSISYFFHGEIKASFHQHPLGIFALGMILWRIYQLIKNNTFQHIKK